MASVAGRGEARAQEGIAPFAAGSGGHVSYGSPDVRADAAPAFSEGAGDADQPNAGTGSSGALVINATFDSSITSNANSAAIQAMINDAVAKYEALFNDPITVSILFRYATTGPNGSPLSAGTLAQSNWVYYTVSWNTFVAVLVADTTTANDASANASLPGASLSTSVLPSSAGGRAVGLNTPPAMFANGSVGAGGPYDGIVTLNSSQPFKFTRPPAAAMYDAERSTEHEIDEVMGLGSYLNIGGSNLRPQDLFSWSAPGTRNLTASGSRYFSIDAGVTNIVGFNQSGFGDFGDWLSGACPQVTPYVQNAFSCSNQTSDVGETSPEGINLDVIGYDLITTGATTTTTSPSPTTTTTSTTTTTTLPDDTGFIAPSVSVAKCEDAVARAYAKYVQTIIKCHRKAATSAAKGVPLDDELCESDPSTGKGARERYEAGIAKIVSKGCGGCATANASGARGNAESFLETQNGQVYCAGSAPFPGGDDPGFVPPDAATAKCEDAVAKRVGAYMAGVIKCHRLAGLAGAKGQAHDDEACESGNVKAKFDAGIAKAVASGCGGCAITIAPTVRDAAESFLDSENGPIYCAGSTPF